MTSKRPDNLWSGNLLQSAPTARPSLSNPTVVQESSVDDVVGLRESIERT